MNIWSWLFKGMTLRDYFAAQAMVTCQKQRIKRLKAYLGKTEEAA